MKIKVGNRYRIKDHFGRRLIKITEVFDYWMHYRPVDPDGTLIGHSDYFLGKGYFEKHVVRDSLDDMRDLIEEAKAS